MAAKDKEAKESKLRELAQKAREERAGNGADINVQKCKWIHQMRSIAHKRRVPIIQNCF